MRSAEIYKALVGFDDGEMTHCDAVEYDDTISWSIQMGTGTPEMDADCSAKVATPFRDFRMPSAAIGTEPVR